MRRTKRYKSPVIGHFTDEQWKKIQEKEVRIPVRAEPQKQEVAPVQIEKGKVMRRPRIR